MNGEPLQPQRQVVNIRTQVYEAIRQNICEGHYQPGQRLQEVELAESLHVSRSPVREALRRLAADGLVVEHPNRGVFVRVFTPQDIEEIFDVRVMLEGYCIRHSRSHMTGTQKQQLLDCLDELTRYHAQGDLPRYIEADRLLHWLFIQLGGNRLIEDIYRRVEAQNQQYRIYSLESMQRFEESLSEHTTIVHCILTGNVEEADRVNRHHLKLARDKINEYLVSRETGGPLK